MKRFYCHCGQEIFFDNTHCNQCGATLGFDSEKQELLSITPFENGFRSVANPDKIYQRCTQHAHAMHCNWLVSDNHPSGQCVSCRLTRLIPEQRYARNVKRWSVLEAAKRRMLYGLLRLGLPIDNVDGETNANLQFHFLEDQLSNPDAGLEQVFSGHLNGVITLNAAEADSSYREAAREAMNEPYRTLLGHFRHEIGHYYWDKLVRNQPVYEDFVRLFGRDTVDYQHALSQHYQHGPVENWQQNYISSYASSHPLEDWAETWAHYLLMHETLETAVAFGVIAQPEPTTQFSHWLSEWMELVLVLNALNRSIGNQDAYPFVISEAVQRKLQFVHDLVNAPTAR